MPRGASRVAVWNGVVLLSCCVASFLAIGTALGLGSVYLDIMTTFNTSRPLAALANSLCIGVGFSAGLFVGPLIGRLGGDVIMAAGGIICCAGLVGSSLAPDISVLILCLGVVTGLGVSCVYLTSLVVISTIYRGRRCNLVVLVAMCSGFGPSVYPPLLRWLVVRYSLRGAFLIMGGICCHAVVVGLVMRLWKTRTQSASSDADVSLSRADSLPSSRIESRSENNPQFRTDSSPNLQFESKSENAPQSKPPGADALMSSTRSAYSSPPCRISSLGSPENNTSFKNKREDTSQSEPVEPNTPTSRSNRPGDLDTPDIKSKCQEPSMSQPTDSNTSVSRMNSSDPSLPQSNSPILSRMSSEQFSDASNMTNKETRSASPEAGIQSVKLNDAKIGDDNGGSLQTDCDTVDLKVNTDNIPGYAESEKDDADVERVLHCKTVETDEMTTDGKRSTSRCMETNIADIPVQTFQVHELTLATSENTSNSFTECNINLGQGESSEDTLAGFTGRNIDHGQDASSEDTLGGFTGRNIDHGQDASSEDTLGGFTENSRVRNERTINKTSSNFGTVNVAFTNSSGVICERALLTAEPRHSDPRHQGKGQRPPVTTISHSVENNGSNTGRPMAPSPSEECLQPETGGRGFKSLLSRTFRPAVLTNVPFVLVTLGCLTAITSINAPLFFLVDMGREHGLSVAEGVQLLTVQYVSSSLSRGLVGTLFCCFPVSALLLLGVAIFATGLTSLGFALVDFVQPDSMFAAMVCTCVLFGVWYGGMVSLISLSCLELVSLPQYPAALGYQYFVLGLSASVAGPLGGWLKDVTGSYNPMFYLAAGQSSLALLVVTVVKCCWTVGGGQYGDSQTSVVIEPTVDSEHAIADSSPSRGCVEPETRVTRF